MIRVYGGGGIKRQQCRPCVLGVRSIERTRSDGAIGMDKISAVPDGHHSRRLRPFKTSILGSSRWSGTPTRNKQTTARSGTADRCVAATIPRTRSQWIAGHSNRSLLQLCSVSSHSSSMQTPVTKLLAFHPSRSFSCLAQCDLRSPSSHFPRPTARPPSPPVRSLPSSSSQCSRRTRTRARRRLRSSLRSRTGVIDTLCHPSDDVIFPLPPPQVRVDKPRHITATACALSRSAHTLPFPTRVLQSICFPTKPVRR